MNKRKVGLVILNYKDSSTTMHLCDMVKGYKCIDNICIVDNHSPDDSYDVLSRIKDSKVDIIKTEKNGGYSYGNNIGVKFLKEYRACELIVIANPDVEFSEQFMNDLVEVFQDESISAASGIMINRNGNIEPYELSIRSFTDDLIDCTILIKKLRLRKQFRVETNVGILSTECIHGSLIAIDTNAFFDIGGFDEGIFLYCEERILGKRFREKGYKMVINTDISYIHMHAVSINKTINRYQQTKLLFSSRLYYWRKYGDLTVFQVFLLRAFMSYGLILRRFGQRFVGFMQQLFARSKSS